MKKIFLTVLCMVFFSSIALAATEGQPQPLLQPQPKVSLADQLADQLITELTDVINESPKDAIAYCQRGNAYSRKRQYNLAINDFSKAIEFNSQYAFAYVSRGNAYSSLPGQEALAIQDYSQAINLDSHYTTAYQRRAALYNKNHQYDLAITDYRTIIDSDPQNVYAYLNLAKAYEKKRSYSEAIDISRQGMAKCSLPQDKFLLEMFKNYIRELGGTL